MSKLFSLRLKRWWWDCSHSLRNVCVRDKQEKKSWDEIIFLFSLIQYQTETRHREKIVKNTKFSRSLMRNERVRKEKKRKIEEKSNETRDDIINGWRRWDKIFHNFVISDLRYESRDFLFHQDTSHLMDVPHERNTQTQITFDLSWSWNLCEL